MLPRILIAEDDDLQGAILRSALEGRGYVAEVVTDGLEAVRRLRTGGYDLALLDYNLPEVDGLAAARLLHDFMKAGDCPRLIAVTAAAEGLTQRELSVGLTSFDAVVSKASGLAALLSIVDANLMSMAELNAAASAERMRLSLREQRVARRERLLVPFAALPALSMVAVFIAAFGWAATSLQETGAAVVAARRTTALSTDSAALVGAVADAGTSQRTYLATGSNESLALFQTDAQRVDQLLVSAAPLTEDGSAGLGAGSADGSPVQVIEPLMSKLSAEASARQASPAAGAGMAPELSLTADRDAASQLRDWASNLIAGSQQAVLIGLEAVRHNVELVLIVLGVGIVYALWNAAGAVQRRWREIRPRDALQPGAMWRGPGQVIRAEQIINAEPSPILLEDRLGA